MGFESVHISPENAVYSPNVMRPPITKRPPHTSITTDSDCAVISRYGKNLSHVNAERFVASQ